MNISKYISRLKLHKKNICRERFIFSKPILLLTILLSFSSLSSCATVKLNKIYTKKIENQSTGKVEEYRTIKISQDDKNDYFLNIKISDQMKPNVTHVGVVNIYTFSIGEANQYSADGLFVLKVVGGAAKIEVYAPWYNKKRNKGEADLSETECRVDKVGDFNVKSCLIKNIIPCCSTKRFNPMKFANQKEIAITKIIQGSGSLWSIEYASKVSPFENNALKEKFNEALNYINDCCQVVAVQKKQAKPI